jgi:hypothetical protein
VLAPYGFELINKYLPLRRLKEQINSVRKLSKFRVQKSNKYELFESTKQALF